VSRPSEENRYQTTNTTGTTKATVKKKDATMPERITWLRYQASFSFSLAFLRVSASPRQTEPAS
jgi:hypothetical protein